MGRHQEGGGGGGGGTEAFQVGNARRVSAGRAGTPSTTVATTAAASTTTTTVATVPSDVAGLPTLIAPTAIVHPRLEMPPGLGVEGERGRRCWLGLQAGSRAGELTGRRAGGKASRRMGRLRQAERRRLSCPAGGGNRMWQRGAGGKGLRRSGSGTPLQLAAFEAGGWGVGGPSHSSSDMQTVHAGRGGGLVRQSADGRGWQGGTHEVVEEKVTLAGRQAMSGQVITYCLPGRHRHRARSHGPRRSPRRVRRIPFGVERPQPSSLGA